MPYRARLFERKITHHPYKRKDRRYLRSDLAMIPLEATMPQADPRRDTIISFIDVSDLLDEEKTTTVPTTKNYPI